MSASSGCWLIQIDLTTIFSLLFNCQALELVEVEYVPEKAELDGVDEEFRKVFEKFNFSDAVTEVRPRRALLLFVILFLVLPPSCWFFVVFVFLFFVFC